jgi:hypothetical protein
MMTSGRLLVLWLLGFIPAAHAMEPLAELSGRASITYVTTSSAYLDAGSDLGLRIGDVLPVVRGDVAVTTLEVTAISSRRASCRRLDASVALVPGDVVYFRRQAMETRPDSSPSIASPGPGSSGASMPSLGGLRRLGIRGRVGLRYFALYNEAAFGSDFSQPGVDLFLEGRGIGKSPIGVFADVRADRTIRTASDGADEKRTRTRTFRLSSEWRSPSGWRVEVGRQPCSSLSSIGIFDGGQAALSRERWGAGVFAGTQPDPQNWGLSSRIRELGAFTELRGPSSRVNRWLVGIGLIASRDEGAINRDYAVVQARYIDPRISMSLAQELDWNHGWKRDVEKRSIDLTSTFATLRFPLGERLSLNAGYDNRRTVRLARDRSTPETEFDEDFRQGVWGGTAVRFAATGSAEWSVRHRTGGSGGETTSSTLSLRCDWSRWHEAAVGGRSTYYTGDRAQGWLHSATTGLSLGGRARLEATGGWRTDRSNDVLSDSQRVTWASLDLECPLANPWYLLLSTERTWGESEKNLQVYASSVLRF